jgi:hypothetical protein
MDSANVPPRARNTRPLAQLLVMLGALAMTACVHGELYTTRPGDTLALTGKVSGVTVTSGGVPLERMGVYEEIGANHLIGEAIISRLVEDGHFDESGDLRIIARITGFRLRSTANVILWGDWTGVDELAGEVDIQLGEDHTNYYGFELSAKQEDVFKATAKSRLRSLGGALAEKISALFGAPSEGEDVAE